MAAKAYYGLVGKLANTLDSVGNTLVVDPNAAIRLSDFVNGTDETWLILRSGPVSEVVRVTAVNGTYLTADRGQEGTLAQPFPAGSEIAYILTTTAVLQEVGTVLPTQISLEPDEPLLTLTLVGPNNYLLGSNTPSIVGVGTIDVMGEWPNLEISYTPPADACCGGGSSGGGSGDIQLYGDGIVETTDFGGGSWGIYAPAVQLSSGAGISVSGTFPNFTISATSTGGVSSVAAGAGLQLTGSPTVNPTLSMANTGVVPGDYGGFVINARGQITAVPAGFNPISSIVAEGALNMSRAGGVVTLTVDDAGVGVPGVVALADSTAYDPDDDTNAITPAGVATALETLITANVNGNSAYIGDADGEYTNVISGATAAISLEAGQKGLVIAEVTVIDPGAPTVPPVYGIGVFNSLPARVQSNRKIPQCQQSMSFVIEGPINTSFSLITTDLGSATLVSYSMSVAKF